MTGDFHLVSVVPQEFHPPVLAKEIGEVSPSSVSIFTQAAAAVAAQLGDIAGVGYRKALEFLIKDFCIGERPNERVGETVVS